MDLSTPIYNLTNYPEVYEPSEDSFLFLDALEQEFHSIKNLKAQFALEIGSGSGILISALASILRNSCAYFAVDVNPDACEATLNTAKLNGATIECLNMDLFHNFTRQNLFDIVLFNPPYVVTDFDETLGNGLNRAWAGGARGRETIVRFLEDLPNVLSEKGVCYLLLLKENGISDIKGEILKKCLIVDVLVDRKIRGEHLYVIKIEREKKGECILKKN